MWDIHVITDQAILANQPDRVLHHKNEETCLLINIAIPDDQKLTQKLKYLEIKVSRMWKVKTKIVPSIFGAFGTIKKGLDQNLQLIPNPSGDYTNEHCTDHL